MRKTTTLFALCFLLAASSFQAAEPEESPQGTTDEAGSGKLIEKVKERVASTAEDDYRKFRIGGYGEMVAAFKDYGINRFTGTQNGNTKDHRNTISIPRFVLAFDYKFSPKWILGAEIEFEAGGTGMAM